MNALERVAGALGERDGQAGVALAGWLGGVRVVAFMELLEEATGAGWLRANHGRDNSTALYLTTSISRVLVRSLGKERAVPCSCGDPDCRLAVADGRCAIDIANEVDRRMNEGGPPPTYEELAGWLGVHSRQAAELALKRAFVAFVAAARRLGYHELVARFKGVRAGGMLLNGRDYREASLTMSQPPVASDCGESSTEAHAEAPGEGPVRLRRLSGDDGRKLPL